MPIHNQIFHTYRMKQKKIEESIKLLEENSYIVMTKKQYNRINNKL